MDVVLIYEGDNLKPAAVCRSKRSATNLIVERLLSEKKIKPAQIGKYRKQIQELDATEDLDVNFKLELVTVNTF